MPFTLCPYRRLPVQCSVTYYAGFLPKLPLAYCSAFWSAVPDSQCGWYNHRWQVSRRKGRLKPMGKAVEYHHGYKILFAPHHLADGEIWI